MSATASSVRASLPRTHWQKWLERHNACVRGRKWVGSRTASETWNDLELAGDMSWLIWKISEGSASDVGQVFFTRAAGEFLSTLAHRGGCDAVRAMVPWLPRFAYGEFQNWSRSQRNWLGSTIVYEPPKPATLP